MKFLLAILIVAFLVYCQADPPNPIPPIPIGSFSNLRVARQATSLFTALAGSDVKPPHPPQLPNKPPPLPKEPLGDNEETATEKSDKN